MLAAFGEGVFTHQTNLRLPGGMSLPSRSTILRPPDEKVIIFSPLRFDDATVRAIEALGEVATIVAPSRIHYFFLKDAIARWPKARVLGPTGLERKVPGVAFEPLPIHGEPDALGGHVRTRCIEGVPYITEHVFLHPATRTLLVTDLVFNLHDVPGLGIQLFLRAVGAWNRTAQSRMWRFVTKNRAAAAASVNEVLGWDFDRLVMAHGEPIDGGAHERTAAALAWLRGGLPAETDLSANEAP
jgi:hypothetical protein